MPPEKPWRDEFTLLCERCGYVLEGIAIDKCPECGKLVEESRPGARKGTAWQRGSGVGAWLRVNWGVVWRPRRTFGAVSMRETRRAWGLLVFNVLVGILLCVAVWARLPRGLDAEFDWYYLRETGSAVGPNPYAGTGVNLPLTSGSRTWTGIGPKAFILPSTNVAAATWSGVLAIGFVFLTWVESVGVRFFGRQRGWRVTKSIAWNVCCHASIGWTIGCLLHALAPLGLIWGGRLLDLLPANTAINIALHYARWAPLLALLIGMLIFETLVYVGVRECRFANRARVGVTAGGEQADGQNGRPDDE